MTKEISFSTVLITGASSGIGKELAKKLSCKCSYLILNGRNLIALEDLKKELSGACKVMIIPSELSCSSGLSHILDIIEAHSPDLVINSAGAGLYGETVLYPLEEQMNILFVNVNALSSITLNAISTLRKNNQKGTILNISSAASFFHYPQFAIYSASKAYVNHLGLSLDAETKKYGIRILTSCPGPVSTQFRLRASKGFDKQSSDNNALSAERAADLILEQIEKKQKIKILGLRMRLLTSIARFLIPESILQKILAKEIKKRISN